MKKFFTLLAMIVFTKISFGQYQQYVQYIMPYLSDTIKSGYFYLNQPNNIQAGQLYETYRQNAPDLNNDMVLIDSHIDSLAGLTHFKYQQTYMNIPIEGAGCIEHYNVDGSLLFLNGKFADSITKSHRPRITKQKAIDLLIARLSRDTSIHFAWNDPDWEHQIQLDRDDSTASWYPKAEILWAIDTMKNMQVVIPGNRYSLAYKIPISTITPFETNIYYVDAQNGAILKVKSTHIHNGPADVYGYGSKVIDSRWKGGFTQAYILETNDAGRSIHTKENPSGGFAWWLVSNTTDDDDNWGNSHLTETSTHYHLSNSWDYFKQTFGRNGLDGNGSEIRVRANLDATNAYYDPYTSPRELGFGKTVSNGDHGREPSVVAHEFTHGVTDYTAGLEYSYESGALNESFSDIFGTVIQSIMLDGGSTDWIIGNFVPNDIQKTRSLEDPKSRGEHIENNNLVLGQPDTYQEQYWYSGTADNGGVHINSGVQNYWFYVLAHGDAGTNDLNHPYNVSGIGMSKATDIAYYALSSILQNSSQYSDSRQATIQAAKILYGECSVEHQATIDAWFAVGIGNLNACTYTLSTDNVDELAEQTLIFPNPASRSLNFEVPGQIDNDIKIFDASGQLVDSFTNTNLVFRKDVTNLSNGLYIVNFSINNTPIRKRIIIQK